MTGSGPGERSPNGTVDLLSRLPTLETHVTRSRVAHGERASAPGIWARCRWYTNWRRRIGGATPSDADADGANHPIRHRQALEGDRHWLGCRGGGTNVVRTVRAGQKCWVGKGNFCCFCSRLAEGQSARPGAEEVFADHGCLRHRRYGRSNGASPRTWVGPIQVVSGGNKRHPESW
jgi:hypothetical protein